MFVKIIIAFAIILIVSVILGLIVAGIGCVGKFAIERLTRDPIPTEKDLPKDMNDFLVKMRDLTAQRKQERIDKAVDLAIFSVPSAVQKAANRGQLDTRIDIGSSDLEIKSEVRKKVISWCIANGFSVCNSRDFGDSVRITWQHNEEEV